MKMKHLTNATAMTIALVSIAAAEPALKDVFREHFLVGVAINEAQFTGQDRPGAALVKRHFNSITPENVLKWGRIHPRPGTNGYEFAAADRFVEFGEQNGMTIIGHTLVWHSQTPRWVFENDQGKPADRETLLKRMRDHIHTVVGRYRGRIQGWDVVNEALNEDGTLRASPWLRIIGEDYLVRAFEFAREADPQAELYYNDFSLENEPKRNGAVALVRKLQSRGVRVDGIGTQQHFKLDWPTLPQVEDTIQSFAALGVKVMITELDMDVLPAATQDRGADIGLRFKSRPEWNPYTNGLPPEVQLALTERYASLFALFVKHSDKISRVTLWGVTDGDSWLNNWPVRGRTSYPLLFDRAGQPKPAFDAVIRSVANPR